MCITEAHISPILVQSQPVVCDSRELSSERLTTDAPPSLSIQHILPSCFNVSILTLTRFQEPRISIGDKR